MSANDLRFQVDRLAEIKRTQQQLRREQDELEADILRRGLDDLKDTKLKTVAYCGAVGKVTVTLAEKLSLVYPSYLAEIFGAAYADAVTPTTTYKLSKPTDRMLSGLWLGAYSEMTVAEVVAQLPDIDELTRKALLKKLRGVNYATDKKNLVTIGGFSETDAEQYAYFVSEAAVWESFQRLLEANGKPDTAHILSLINAACVVEETPKITIE